tara:strand:- start:16237 stop:16875 length:639 start_codon:yes stop_codon:yes gene_type:complete
MGDVNRNQQATHATKLTDETEEFVAKVAPDSSGDNRLFVKSQQSFVDPNRLIRERIKRVSNDSIGLNVNGSGTPIPFEFKANPLVTDKDILISSIKLFGTDGNIKVSVTNFMGLNSELTNGLLIEFITDGATTFSRTIKDTVEFLGLFSSGASDNNIIAGSGGDYIESKFDLTAKSLELNLKAGTTDLIRVTVQDNLNAVDALYMLIDGREA